MSHEVFVAPLSSSLSNWGFTSHAGPAPPSLGGHILDLHQLRTQPISFDARAFNSSSPHHIAALVTNLLFVMVCVALLLLCLLSNGDENENEEIPGYEDASGMLSPTRKKFRDAQCSSGSWAQAYREACSDDREAMELLFRCHIISTYEFAESKVSREHIHECIWIATYMLQQKSLSEWVATRHEAKRRFEESAVSCFRAESDGTSLQHSKPSSPGNSQQPEQGALFSPRSSTASPLNVSRQILSTSSSLSSDLQQQMTPRITPPGSARGHQQAMSRPRVQPPQQHEYTQQEFEEKVLSPSVVQRRPQDNAITNTKEQQKVSFRPAVPRVNLEPLSLAKAQSYREDDDDPYTTRDIY